jgi:hypothetical protein
LQPITINPFWISLTTIYHFFSNQCPFSVIPKHKEEATDDIREKGERG